MKSGFAAVVLGASLFAHGPAAADPTCPPAARVAGDEELGRAVALELSILGVASDAIPAGCPAVEVVVEPSGASVAVSLRDGSGRETTEVVTDTSVAASWIESWVHPEIGAPLLAARTAPGQAALAGHEDVTVSSRPSARPGRFTYQGLWLGAGGELLSASDDSGWRGLSASVCARFGLLCAGLSARAADNRGVSLDDGFTESNRYQLELLATAGAALELGRMTLVPSAGLGIGYTHTGRGDGSTCINEADPTGVDTCKEPYKVDDAFSAYNLGPRAEVGIAGAFPIAGPLSLTLGVAVSFVPMARDEAVMPDYAEEYFDTLPDNEPGSDPDRPDDGSGMELYYPMESYQLPAEPTRFTRISLGLVWELR